MIRRLGSVRLRLIDAVAIAALALLGLKVAGFVAGTPSGKDAAPAGSSDLAPGEQLPAFGRVIANARTNYVPPDIAMTGAVPDKNEAAAADKKDEKPPAHEAPKQKRLSIDGAAAPSSPSERAVLERLGERREEIQQKGRELEMRERLLENAERKLDSRINELRSIEDKAQEATKKADPEAAALRNLVTMYEAMKPKDAARVFDRLSHDVLVPVVVQMNPRKMAEVLAVMSPEAAEKLTVALANRARGVGPEARLSAGAGALPAGELPSIDPPAARPGR
jgi:flagellar motility protein MotE (MotC chaperone)